MERPESGDRVIARTRADDHSPERIAATMPSGQSFAPSRSFDSHDVGVAIRGARKAKGLSLKDVADRALISVATLSRIENSKQALDMNLFLTLADILEVTPSSLIDGDRKESLDSLVDQLASLVPSRRIDLWTALRESRSTTRREASTRIHQIVQEVEELLAQIDFVKAEVESLRSRLKSSARR
jgi:transcriptional regulator with XRE-family HTH domain